MKTSLKLFVLITVMALSTPLTIQARELSVEQIKQNVINLQKSLIEEQSKVTVKDFKKIIRTGAEFVLLDVRSEDEFKAAHLPGALHVERGRLEWIIPNIIKKSDRKIFVYCENGRRSAFATEQLVQLGYTNTTNIIDGFEAWVSAGNLVYNMHGEFMMTTKGYKRREPILGKITKK